MEALLQYLANGLLVGGVYALIAMGIVIIYKASGIFNFAVGQMMMFGAFFCWTFIEQLGLPPLLSLLLSLIAGAALGLLIERFTLRKLIGQPVLSAIMMTLAVSYFLGGQALGFFGSYLRPLPRIFSADPINLGGVVLASDLLWSFITAMVVFGLLALFYQRSRMGLAMRATAESHQIAQARGINVRSVFSLTWALAGIVATIGGILLGYRLGLSNLLASIGLKAFPAVILGGVESIAGALIGGLVVGVLETLAGGLINPWIMEITPYIIILLVLVFMPEGLFGLKRIERI